VEPTYTDLLTGSERGFLFLHTDIMVISEEKKRKERRKKYNLKLMKRF
jgi:hypothetical protein